MREQQQAILHTITRLFAAEDEALCFAREQAHAAGLPEIHMSPLQGKLLQLLAAACNAQHILEIGTLAGYSGIWLARALPEAGRLVTIEINPTHADLALHTFRQAQLAHKIEVLVGNALEVLPQLQQEERLFDLIVMDADKPQYLNLALLLSHAGTIIVADNCLPGGSRLRYPVEGSQEAVQAYTTTVAHHPGLVSLALPLTKEYTDGFTIAVVRPQQS